MLLLLKWCLAHRKMPEQVFLVLVALQLAEFGLGEGDLNRGESAGHEALYPCKIDPRDL